MLILVVSDSWKTSTIKAFTVKMQVSLPMVDVSLGGGRGYPEGCTCGVDGHPSHEQELSLITFIP